MALDNPTTEAVSVKQQVAVPDLLLLPRITEKAQQLAGLRKYVFIVPIKANKVSVRKAVEKQHGVKVLTVNMVRMEGKARRYGKAAGKLSDYKKAIVTLSKDSKQISFGEAA